MIFINETQTPYVILSNLTNNVTGSWFLTILLVFLLIIGVSMLLRMEIEYTVIFILPLSILLMAFTGEFMAIGFCILLYSGLIIAKNFFFK